MTISDWIAIAALIALTIYCIDTRKIRKATQAQLEAQRTPCLTFATTPRDGGEAILGMGGARGTMILKFHEGDAVLTNIGNGPAVNIEYVLTGQGRPHPLRKFDGYVPFIPPGSAVSVPIARGALQDPDRPFDCAIQYDSLSFTRYETKVVIKNLVLTPPFRFGKASPTKAREGAVQPGGNANVGEPPQR